MQKKIRSIAILHSDAKREYFATQSAYETEKYAERDAQAVGAYAKRLAEHVSVFPASVGVVKNLIALRPDVVINLVDSIEGDDKRTPEICAVLDFLKIHYTGNHLSPLLLCYDKFFVKKIIEQYGVPTPKGILIGKKQRKISIDMRFPVISKLNDIHGSVGLTKDSISVNVKHLEKRIRKLQKNYNADILVEEYIEGKEVSAFVVEDKDEKQVYMSEDIFEDGKNPFAIASYEMRWEEENPVIESRKYTNTKVEGLVLKAFTALKMSGYSKFDLRVRDGIPYFIDINPNPAFGPPENDSPIAKTLQNLYDVPFTSLLSMIVSSALKKK